MQLGLPRNMVAASKDKCINRVKAVIALYDLALEVTHTTSTPSIGKGY